MRTKAAVSLGGHKIPRHRYNSFREILEACNGRMDYAYTLPRHDETEVGFHFVSGLDYAEWCKRWEVMTTGISEVRRDAKWRKCLRRLKLGFIEKTITRKGADMSESSSIHDLRGAAGAALASLDDYLPEGLVRAIVISRPADAEDGKSSTIFLTDGSVEETIRAMTALAEDKESERW